EDALEQPGVAPAVPAGGFGDGDVLRFFEHPLQSDEQLAKDQYQGEKYIRLQRMFEEPQNIAIPKATGGHGGGDARLLQRIFIPDGEPDELGRDATHIDGAASVLTGVAANRSIENKLAIAFDELWPKNAPAAKV
ncbi:MAG: hypothetical protein AAGH92_00430, partial [Planctomycetota bacterium]